MDSLVINFISKDIWLYFSLNKQLCVINCTVINMFTSSLTTSVAMNTNTMLLITDRSVFCEMFFL